MRACPQVPASGVRAGMQSWPGCSRPVIPFWCSPWHRVWMLQGMRRAVQAGKRAACLRPGLDRQVQLQGAQRGSLRLLALARLPGL